MAIKFMMKDTCSKINISSKIASDSFVRMRTCVHINGRSQAVDIRKKTNQKTILVKI